MSPALPETFQLVAFGPSAEARDALTAAAARLLLRAPEVFAEASRDFLLSASGVDSVLVVCLGREPVTALAPFDEALLGGPSRAAVVIAWQPDAALVGALADSCESIVTFMPACPTGGDSALEGAIEAVRRQDRRLLAREAGAQRQAREVDRLRRDLQLAWAVIQETPAVLYAKDSALRYTLSNTRHAEVSGRTVSEIIGRTETELFGEAAAPMELLARQVLESGEPVVSEFDLDLGGDLRTFHETVFAIRGPDGVPLGVAGTATDLTENRRTQRKLQRLRRTFQVILNDSPVALVLVSADGRVTLANEEAERLLQRSPVSGLRLAELLADEASRAHLEHLRAVVASVAAPGAEGAEAEGFSALAAARTLDSEIILPSGVARPVELRASVVELPSGLGVLVSLIDLTARKASEAALRQAQSDAEAAARAKGTFLAHMSHEIRTPLNAVLGFAQLLERDPTLGGTQRARVQTIMRAGDHLLTLVNQVLDMSVIESGRVEVHTETVRVAELIESVLEMFEHKAGQARLSLSARLEAELPTMFQADAGKIRQILVNLLGNALRITKRGGVQVAVGFEPPRGAALDGFIAFSVSDTGPGLAPRDLARIFGAFEQAGTAEQRGGAGLGLSISRRYAELMGGTLTAESVLGEGATFTLRLPARGAGPRAGAAARPEAATLRLRADRRRTVAVVEDASDNREAMTLALEGAGFSVVAFTGGDEALARIPDAQPDLLLTDFQMRGMDGLSLIRALRATSPPWRGPAVVVSASVFDDLERRTAEAGGDAYVRKPVRHAELLALLMRLLGLTRDDFDALAPLEQPAAVTDQPASVGELPETLRLQLAQALDAADYAAIQALAAELDSAWPGLARAARQAVASFDWEPLRALLEAPQPTSEEPDALRPG
jgi:PAS domain S-box-containing protein